MELGASHSPVWSFPSCLLVTEPGKTQGSHSLNTGEHSSPYMTHETAGELRLRSWEGSLKVDPSGALWPLSGVTRQVDVVCCFSFIGIAVPVTGVGKSWWKLR